MQDKRAKDLAVTNGISCMGCHEFGMIKAKDEIRKIALGGPGGKAFSRAELREIDGLYPENERMDRIARCAMPSASRMRCSVPVSIPT